MELELEDRIGSLDDPDEALTEISTVLIGPEGQTLVAQPMEDWIRVYDRSGGFEGTIGGTGEGPGEFGSLRLVGLQGDTLTVHDSSAQRATWMTLSGAVVRSVRWAWTSIPANDMGVGFNTIAAAAIVASDSLALVIPPATNTGERTRPEGTGVVVADTLSRPILATRASGRNPDTVAVDPWIHQRQRVSHGGREISLFCPWKRDLLYAFRPDGSGVVAIGQDLGSVADPASYRVHLIGPEGDTIISRDLAYSPRPMTGAEVLDEMQALRAARAEADPTFPSAAEVESGFREHSDCIPESHPPVSAVAAAQDGTIWIRREATRDEMIAWDVLDRDLAPIGRVMLPTGQTVAAARGDILIVTELDEYDVPYLTRYRVVR